jgi:hypothetical protein
VRGLFKLALLKVDQSEAGVRFGHVRRQIAELFVCLRGLVITPSRQSFFAFL